LDHYTADVFEATPQLQILARYGAGVDRVDLEAAARAGVVVTNTPAANADSVADLAVGLMLAVARRIPAADRGVREGQWPRMYGVSLSGKTIGLVGLGQIGIRVAQRVQGFGCTVLACDPFVSTLTALAAKVCLVQLDELLASADFVSLHLPAGAETVGMFDAEKFGKMKRTAILVNTARAEVVEQAALVDALRNGKIAGAGLDAHLEEPPDTSQYEGMDNVVLTPHIGGYTEEALRNMAMGSVVNLCAWFDGEEPPNIVVKPQPADPGS
jgi:D-3-phosphoglycerate dehydrogenase